MLLIIVFLFQGINAFSQVSSRNAADKKKTKPVKEKGSIDHCFNYILEQQLKAKVLPLNLKMNTGNTTFNGYKISVSEQGFSIYKAASTTKLKLQSKSNSIDGWNEVIDWKTMKYGLASVDQTNYLIAKAQVAGPSGLITNFTKYLIVNMEKGFFFIEQSLSDNTDFFFEENKKLNFHLFDYSDQFLKERDYDHISLTISQYIITDNQRVLVKETVKKCR